MTAELVTDALVMAIWRRGRPRELLHHSDRGSQYTSEAFQRLMAEHGVTCSLDRRSGNVWDNAAMESFFSSLKVERVARKTYRTRDQARADVFDYIERFYNPRRQALDDRLSQPDGVRTEGAISLGWCLPNRQRLKGHLDRIEVRAVGRQQEDPGAPVADELFGLGAFVCWQVVHDNGIAVGKGRASWVST